MKGLTTDRRTFVKTLGAAAGVTAIGGGALLRASGSASANAEVIGATDTATVTNDRGDVSQVTIDPSFTVSWSGMDDAVGKVFMLVEAKTENQSSFSPVYRATPWLSEDAIGTSGEYGMDTFTDAIESDDRFPDSEEADPIVLVDEQGEPDYSALSFPGGVDLQSYLNGVSVGSATNYPNNGVVLQNHKPSVFSGYYGAAADTAAFDEADDGSSSATGVSIRYTFELQRPNFSQLSGIAGISQGADESDEAFAERLAEKVDGVQPSDIDAGNSRVVMNGEDGLPSLPVPSGIPYDEMQANASNHPGLIVATADFDVPVQNVSSSGSGDGSSNTGAS